MKKILPFLFAFLALSLQAQVPISMDAAYVKDSRMPGISDADLQSIFAAARFTLKQKFGLDKMTFNLRGTVPVDQFFARYLNTKSDYYKSLNPKRYRFFQKNDFTPFSAEITKFLAQYKVWDLADFFPDKKKDIKTYDQVVPLLMDAYFQKLSTLEGLKLKNGVDLIDKKNNTYQSYINWLIAMNEQDSYDLIIANTFIVYDMMNEPYPHVVTRFAKVGGSSFESPKRKGFGGYTAMFNVFEMLTDIPYFQSPYAGKNISMDLWDKIIGSYIVAHELGHMIYLIPDVYNHDHGCLMDSSKENLDYYEGYKELEKYPEPCSKCQPYVEARNHFFNAEAMLAGKDFQNALGEYRLALKTSPDKLDGDVYKKYMSQLNYKMSVCSLGMNDKTGMANYLQRALQLDPENKDALLMQKTVK
jgi:hypothetical protein